MNKLVALILIPLLAILVYSAFRNFNFGVDAIWKIEEQRREHTILFPSIAPTIHNKGFYLGYVLIDNYLSYFSPSAFLCCGQFFLVEVIILLLFYAGVYFLIVSDSKISKVIIGWILIYPLFPALMLQPPSYLLLIPLIIPALFVLTFLLFKSNFKMGRNWL